MTTFVLVHPAWIGGSCWRKLVPLLRVHGHEVHTPTLTGLGERAHLAHPGIDLHVHITDIVNVLVNEDLHCVVLLGTSSAGMVITGVAAQAPERIGHLVYLDAFVPDDGQCLLDLVRTAGRRWRHRSRAKAMDGCCPDSPRHAGTSSSPRPGK